MGKPKLAVSEVFVLQEVFPWEGTDIIGVFASLEAAKEARPGQWRQRPQGDWTTSRSEDELSPSYFIAKYPVRSK